MFRKMYKKVGLIVILPLALYTTSAIATTINITGNQNETWQLDKINSLFLIAQQPAKVYWYVDGQVKDKDGKTYQADTVEIDCDGTISKVVANTYTTCNLKAGRRMDIRIASEDFHHGSAGTWNAEAANR